VVLALLALLFTMNGMVRADDGAVSKEYRLKAAFLVNFAKFVKWPGPSSEAGQKPLVIGVFDKNPFGASLEGIARVQKINGREIIVKQVATVEEAGAVNVLFVSEADDGLVAQTLAALKGKAVLTVGETDAFAQSGGMITLTREGDKLRFEINAESAEREKLVLSAELLKLAKPAPKQP